MGGGPLRVCLGLGGAVARNVDLQHGTGVVQVDRARIGRLDFRLKDWATVADGRLYRRAEVEEALARYDAHFHGRVYDSVMGVVVSLLQGSFAPDRGTPRAAS